MSSFAKRLKEVRSQLKLNQREFAKLAGVSQSAQTMYEKEDTDSPRVPDANYLQRLADHGIDINYLVLGNPDGPDQLTEEEAFLLEQFRNASPEMREHLITTARLLK